MNRRLLEATLALLPPETRRAVNWVRFQMAAQGMTDEEFVAAVTVLGYLVQLLTGKTPFDRWQLRQYINLTAQDDPKCHRLRRGNGG